MKEAREGQMLITGEKEEREEPVINQRLSMMGQFIKCYVL